ncbi:MAG: glycosyl hydrolase, partial [Dorea sp.]
MPEKNVRKVWESIRNEARPKIRYWIPAAAVDEADLKEELRCLKERGFGGVEVVALLGTPDEIIGGEDGWGTPHWNQTLKVIEETTRSLGMTMDVANGPAWPISMPGISSADDPAALCELTFGVEVCKEKGGESVYRGTVPKRRMIREEGKERLLHVFAYQQNREGFLVQSSYTDLRNFISGCDQNAVLDTKLPLPEEGYKWLVFAFFVQPAAQKTGNGRYYVIDHLSESGVQACKEYWEPLMKEFGNYPSMESFFCDSLEYQVALDWTRGLELIFEEQRGYSLLPYLPFIGYSGTYPESDAPGYELDHPEISEMVNRDYLEVLTQCYCENHLKPLEEMAEKYGKSVRYQVAYNKPFEEERCGLYVGIPENEALGRPSMDGLKAMAAAAHLGRKKRYSFECAAEFGNSYGQNYEDLFWWVKRSLMAGMNAQVLHGGSYSGAYYGKYADHGFMKNVQWPGYEAFFRGVSNYWNRTLSVKDARGCMDAIARLNTIFLKQASVDCAVYRASYQNDGKESEFCYFKDMGNLTNHGYTYETISPKLLGLSVCKVSNGRLDEEGVGYQCLLIPEQTNVSLEFLKKVKELLEADFPVIWLGRKPEKAAFYMEWRNVDGMENWQQLMNTVWSDKNLIHGQCEEDVVNLLKNAGVEPDVQLDGKMNIVTAEHIDRQENIRYYALYGYNCIEYTPDDLNPEELACSAFYRKGTTKSTYQRPGEGSRKTVIVRLKGIGQVYQMNPWDGSIIPIDFVENSGWMEGEISIEEDELVLLALAEGIKENILYSAKKEVECEVEVTFDTLRLQEFLPETSEEKSFLRSRMTGPEISLKLEGLKPWRELSETLETFAGQGIYEGKILLQKKEVDKKYVLSLGDVSDTFVVYVNGKETPFPDQVLKEVELTDYLREGTNEIKVRVVSNLYNRLLKDYSIPMLPIKIP